MIEKEFEDLLIKATEFAFDFGQKHVYNNLPVSIVYDVELNRSYDAHNLPQFDLYPEDDGKVLKGLNGSEVIELLLRKGKIPVWIDIFVKDITDSHTVMNLYCAGRYTDDLEETYYHKRQQTGPFGIKSPILSKGYREGVKFDLKESVK